MLCNQHRKYVIGLILNRGISREVLCTASTALASPITISCYIGSVVLIECLFPFYCSLRYVAAAQHVTSVSSSGILNPLYLSHQQQQSLPTLHPPFSTQQLGSSPHSGRDYHPHQSHSQGLELSGGLSQRTHLVNTGLGLSLSHSPMHIPQHRRPPGQRVSLLRDIGIAGERERDRTETSVSSVLPHSFSAGNYFLLFIPFYVYLDLNAILLILCYARFTLLMNDCLSLSRNF